MALELVKACPQCGSHDWGYLAQAPEVGSCRVCGYRGPPIEVTAGSLAVLSQSYAYRRALVHSQQSRDLLLLLLAIAISLLIFFVAAYVSWRSLLGL